MNIKNLVFFDNSGYNLNFEWNESLKLWEGNIYFPKVSVGLYTNTNIYVMEKIVDSHNEEKYYFPQKGDSNDNITFTWDILNTFVDEFFMFTFDTEYYAMNDYETSALEYTPNAGPELETLIVNRFEKYEVELDNDLSTKALPIHVAFSSPAKFDATTFKRTLDMSYGSKTIAKITFFAETVEEDERLKIWNNNLGYHIKPEDTIIFKDSDIKECYPDYKLLNEKRKELMIEGHNIYPYIGSYKAIVNVIKYFGYENLNIVEYWRNVDSTSENFGKIFVTSKYKLTNKETLNVGGKTISLPNRNYRKVSNISLVYTINHPLKEVDQWELPLVKEDFTYTLEEVMIKLFALRRKLNDEFMPSSSRIVDIIGEATYFGLQEILNNAVHPPVRKIPTPDGIREVFEEHVFDKKRVHHPSISVFPSSAQFTPNKKYITERGVETLDDLEENLPPDFKFNTCIVNITDNRQFRQYAIEQHYDAEFGDNSYKINLETPIENLQNVQISSVEEESLNNINYLFDNIPLVDVPTDDDTGNSDFEKRGLTDYYEEYYNKVKEGSIDEIIYEPNCHDDDNDIKPSAKIILENTSFDKIKFGQIFETFGVDESFDEHNENDFLEDFTCDTNGNRNNRIRRVNPIDDELTFGNIDTRYYGFDKIRWVVKTSSNQIDKDFDNIGVKKEFERREFTFDTGLQDIDLYKKVLVELPYFGYYDVEMYFKVKGIATTVKYVFENAIKVEPFNLDIRGFYYDARSLPEDLAYDIDTYGIVLTDTDETIETSDIKKFILERLTNMTNVALEERMYEEDKDKSLPRFGFDSEDSDEDDTYTINGGPYASKQINQKWYMLDNLNYDITTLKPNKNVESARYIKNAVDVKPYTWFLLGFDESKITSVVNPKWKLTNLTTKECVEHEGRYFTLLLKKEGDYMIELSLSDTNGNKYYTSRNIIIVDKDANYKLYKLFRDDYDAYTEEKSMRDKKFYEEFARLGKAIDYDEE